MKYLVISHDSDEQQTFYDRVVAPDENGAMEIVGEIRDYAIPSCAFTADELIDNGQSLAEATEDELEKETQMLRRNHYKDLCESLDG
jgi:hypothetical protein